MDGPSRAPLMAEKHARHGNVQKYDLARTILGATVALFHGTGSRGIHEEAPGSNDALFTDHLRSPTMMFALLLRSK